jgi:hypothetical protein
MSRGCGTKSTTSSKISTPSVAMDSCGILTRKTCGWADQVLSEFGTPKFKEDGGFEDFRGDCSCFIPSASSSRHVFSLPSKWSCLTTWNCRQHVHERCLALLDTDFPSSSRFTQEFCISPVS